jgi:hypothetical protein
MWRRIVSGILAIGLVYFYVLALVNGIGFAAARREPAFWAAIFPTRHSGALSWILVSHFAAVLLVSLPFAWIVVRLYGRYSLLVSLAIALLIWGVFEAPLVLYAYEGSGVLRALWLADTVQFIGLLPVLSALFRRLSPTNRFERPVAKPSDAAAAWR